MIQIGEVSALAQTLLEADRDVAELEEKLSARKEQARVLREESLPMAMMELGLKQLMLDSGEKISVKQEVFATLTKGRKEEALSWLEEHGFGGLIKTEVSTQFGRDELVAAKSLVEKLEGMGLAATMNRDVHPQTLRAFLREQLEAATPNLPLDMFGARACWMAKITAPK